jgi:hypothetical protein
MNNQNDFFRKAHKYNLLASFCKYEPVKHMAFYQKHLKYLHKALEQRTSFPAPARIRFLHASPDAPKSDIYVNGRVLLRGLAFQDISETILFSPGPCFIDIYPSNKTWESFISKKIHVSPGEHVLFAAAGMLKKIQLLRYPFDSFVPRQEAKLRFIHLSPDSPPIDWITESGDFFFQDVSFKEATDYIGMTPMTAKFTAKQANGEISSNLEITLEPGRIYSIICTGTVKGETPIDFLYITDH